MRQRDLRSPPPEPEPTGDFGYVSYWAFALSLIAGLMLGIAITRDQGPLQRSNAEPWQLRTEDRQHYMMAIALEYAYSGDAGQALNKLIRLRPAHDPLQALAEGACALGSRGYLGSESGIKAMRSAVSLYTSQGREGCAQQLLPPEVTEVAPEIKREQSTADLRPTPQPTKRPLQDSLLATPTRHLVPTRPAERTFEPLSVRSFCDLSRPAIIEVHVVDYIGRGIPGQRIRVRWGAQEDIFVSGLKVDRGDSYADFQMEEDIDYAIDMPGSNALGASLRTGNCFSNNRRTLKSYRVTFVET